MPPRDEQDFEMRRQQIIDGALLVFSKKGFERATNKDIAEAANIGSPGLIYHYFKDKADLLRHVLEQRAPAIRLIGQMDDYMDQPPQQVLSLFVEAFVQMAESPTNMALFRLILGESTRQPAVATMVNAIGPGRLFSQMSRYISHQIELGVLRAVHPGAAARSLFGPIVAYLITRAIFPQPDLDTLNARDMARTAVDIFLRGMLVVPENTADAKVGAPEAIRS